MSHRVQKTLLGVLAAIAVALPHAARRPIEWTAYGGDYGDLTNRGVSTGSIPPPGPITPCGRRVFVAPVDARPIGQIHLDRSAGLQPRVVAGLRSALLT